MSALTISVARARSKFALLVFTGIAVASVSLVPNSASAIDVSPGAYIPGAVGSKTVMAYWGGSSADSYHPRRDSALDNGTKLETRSALLRLFYVNEIADRRVQYQVALPYVKQELKLNGNDVGETQGLADPFVAITTWPLIDNEKRRYLGLTGYLYLPAGRYHHDSALNTGSNRYVGALQAGYSQSWGAMRLDLTADVSVYGDNKETGVAKRTTEQDPTYVLQPWLTYTFPNRLSTSVGLTKTWGGRSELDGVDTNRATDSLRARFAVGYWVAPKTQVYMELARDLEVSGGYKFDHSATLRLTQIF